MISQPDKKHNGVIIPTISPINEDFTIDSGAIERLLESFIQHNVDAFLLGTTGESVSFSIKQKNDLVKKAVSFNNKRCKIYAGISGNSLPESIEEAIRYHDLGVETVVAHLPFYYPITDQQMLRYYEQLAKSVPCSLFIYNNPITTNISIPVEVIEKLSYHENIVGVKDSERCMERLDKSIELWSPRKDFSYLLGWAAQSAYGLLKGIDGIVPSTGNIIPGLYKELFDAALSGDKERAMDLQEKTDKVSAIYQKNKRLNQSLAALKGMMSFYRLCQPYMMPPLLKLSGQELRDLKKKTAAELDELI
jgi:4-hydroxy-tetrahydrodipicolinate synthase